jgi:hypothetical protein
MAVRGRTFKSWPVLAGKLALAYGTRGESG